MKIYSVAEGIYMDDGNRKTFFAHDGYGVGGVILVDAIPEEAELMQFEKPRKPEVSPAEKWGDRMARLVAEKRVSSPLWGSESADNWLARNVDLVAAIKAVCVEQYAPAKPPKVAKDFDELKRIAGGKPLAGKDREGDLFVWQEDHDNAYMHNGKGYLADLRIAFPVEVLAVSQGLIR